MVSPDGLDGVAADTTAVSPDALNGVTYTAMVCLDGLNDVAAAVVGLHEAFDLPLFAWFALSALFSLCFMQWLGS